MENAIFVRIPIPERFNTKDVHEYLLESLQISLRTLGVVDSWATPGPPWLCEVMNWQDIVLRTEQFLGSSISISNEKRKIMERLQLYRRTKGLGCWAAVVKASGGKLNDFQLRDMAAGVAVLPMTEWQRAGKALDKLCQ